MQILATNKGAAVLEKPQTLGNLRVLRMSCKGVELTADLVAPTGSSKGVSQTPVYSKRKIFVDIKLTNPGSLLPEINWGIIILRSKPCLLLVQTPSKEALPLSCYTLLMLVVA